MVQHLGAQMYPKNSKFLVEAFEDATKIPYGYLLLDLRQDTPEDMRVRTTIFPEEQEVVYAPI